MSKLLLISLALISTQALAAPKKLNVELQYFEDGKLLSSPSLTLEDLKTAEIEDGKIRAKITPRVVAGQPKDQIMVEMEITKAGGKAWNPSILALEGESASLESGEVDKSGKPLGTHKVSVLVTENE